MAMEPWAITTITVMILAIFAATAIATLLDVFGIRRLPEEYRKPLFGALILEVVGIVLWQVDFRPDDSSGNSDDETTVTTSSSASGATTPNGLTGEISNGSEQPENTNPSDTIDDDNAPASDNSDGENSGNIGGGGTDADVDTAIDGQSSTTVASDDAVQLWAHGADQKSGALGQKPPGAAALSADYPGCVKSVLDRDTPFPPYTTSKAYDCAKNVEQFRTLYISPYYERKKLYDERLVKWDKQLVNALDDVSIERRRYIKREKDRLNDSASGELSIVAEIDRRSLNDKDYCATNNCQKP
ncbi:hypothetical protein ACR9YC_12845 [Parasphingorhabdus sp. DH2-15]|uniref:hypothetical protein n=1 Tax=Parasphingorhabdus sp. DH2-15 TaxID=3444112 RepID=UPI003F684611